jgi:ATP-dependent Clp protease ATP-binding subunit ClpB
MIMRFDKFTIKAQETIRKAQETAAQNNHQAIEPEHLLSAMLEEPEGIARAIISKMGASPEKVRGEIAAALANLPVVSGGSEQYLSRNGEKVLEVAVAEAASMKDDYVSTEHVLLALLTDGGRAGRVLHESGLTRDALLKALKGIRGSQRVTDPNPEEKYQALENTAGISPSWPGRGAWTR